MGSVVADAVKQQSSSQGSSYEDHHNSTHNCNSHSSTHSKRLYITCRRRAVRVSSIKDHGISTPYCTEGRSDSQRSIPNFSFVLRCRSGKEGECLVLCMHVIIAKVAYYTFILLGVVAGKLTSQVYTFNGGNYQNMQLPESIETLQDRTCPDRPLCGS